jgi:hypothetical protein
MMTSYLNWLRSTVVAFAALYRLCIQLSGAATHVRRPRIRGVSVHKFRKNGL